MGERVDGKFSLDLISAYAASLSRIASWVVAAGVVYRYAGPDAFAVFALIRTTIGLLNYAGFGLAPAMIHEIAKIDDTIPVAQDAGADIDAPDSDILNYARGPLGRRQLDATRRLYMNGLVVSLISFAAGLVLLILYNWLASDIHNWPSPPQGMGGGGDVILGLGFGTLLRLTSDSSSALLQSSKRVAIDNSVAIIGDLFWIALCIVGVVYSYGSVHYAYVPQWYTISGFLVLVLRLSIGTYYCPLKFILKAVDFSIVRSMFTFGLGVTIAQLADFLYAPTDNILINRFINPETVAVYAPAIQIDAGLLVLVAGLSSVLLPRAAVAHASGDHSTLLKYYTRGTLASAIMLLCASVGVWIASSFIFKMWFDENLPATQAILPLVLIHTIVGGSSGVGRSILLGMGKVKAFTKAVLIAGVANVLMSFCFVYFCNWGLKGIILGTILAVVGRCAIWMPWYVRKSIREMKGPMEQPEPPIAQMPQIP